MAFDFSKILQAYNVSGGQPGGVQPMQSPIGMPPVGSAEKDAKSQKMAMLLYALGGALKGKDPLESGMAVRQMQQQQQSQAKLKKQEQARNEWIKNNPQYAEQISAIEAGVPKEFLTPKALFEGQSTTNQFYNTLLKGQQDESIRSTPQYKTAYNYLSQPKTETFLNQQGQQVTRSVPGMISKQDYLPPVGDSIQPLIEGSKIPTDEDIVVQVSPERRKGLLKDIDTSQSVLSRLDYLDETIDRVDPNPFTIGTERAEVGSAYNDLLLILKDYAKLGVLAGADLELLNNWVGDPMAYGQFFSKGGAAGTRIQIKSLKDSILRGEAKIRAELGEKTATPQGAIRQETAFLNGKQLILNSDGTGWIFKDTGEPAQ